MSRKKASCECGQVMMGYTVESVVGIDDRGQMVLPKDIRRKLGVGPDDRLAIATSSRNGKVCCIHLFRAKELDDRVKEVVRPAQETARE
ncbi:MAG: AbrB/MazE/SpoVT family DNA-binding domain-containing protein [Methanomassiliicoccales archaeon]|nr:AbrB/MazE/SpoVT family DNA-binding domain-containing protein [Methanomassiliicoccales archaeon]